MSSNRRLQPLDGLRGLAVLLVLLFHLAGGAKSTFAPLRILGEINKAGWIGVTLFFLLSGFLITGILWDSRGEAHWARNFYLRRILRIFPVYYLVLALFLAASLFTHTFAAALSHVWVPALFLQDLPGSFNLAINSLDSPLALFHYWTLAVEEQFYLLWPFLLFTQRSPRGVLRLATLLFVLSAAFRFALWHLPQPEDWLYFPLTRAGELAAGAWLAIAYRTPPLWQRLTHIAPWLAALGFVGFAATSLAQHSAALQLPLQTELGLPLITFAFAGLLILALQQGTVSRLTSLRPLRWLGRISYGLYVYVLALSPVFNILAARIVHAESGQLFGLARFFVSSIGGILIATLSYRYLETPFLRLKRRFHTEPAIGSA